MSDHDLHPAFVLANRVIEARETRPIIKMQGNYFLLTDEALHRLIRLAYDASLMQEEGRFPSARLVCSRWKPKVRFGSNIPWDSPKFQDADVIRRLAPIANRAGSALAITTVSPTDIRCIGLYEFAEIIDPIGRTANSNVWEMGETLSGPLLTVRIEGPGQIRAGFLPAQVYTLRGGQIRERRSWFAVPAVSTLFEVVGKSLHTRLSQIEHALIAKVLFNPSQSKNISLGVQLAAPAGHRAVWRGQPYAMQLGTVELELTDGSAGYQWQTTVGFSAAPIAYALLGNRGCLQFFDATFCGKDLAVELTINRSFQGTVL